MSATVAADAEAEQQNVNELFLDWLEEHRRELAALQVTLDQITGQLDRFGDIVDERLQDESFLEIVRKGFRTWNDADTTEKREAVRRLLTNAAATKLCSDDVVRLFLDWINLYHEAHFRVIGVINRNPGCTRASIWHEIHGASVREDSADADLFKMLVRDLSTGGVIRQCRPVTAHGEFAKKRKARTVPGLPVLKSAFCNVEPYELTALGKQFVHYTMEETAPRLSS